MPRVDVVVTFLSGEQLKCRLKHSRDIMSVKRWIKHELGMPKWRIMLRQCDDDAHDPCRDDALLSDLVIPAKPLYLQVVIKDAITICDGCAQEGCDYQRCSQCLGAWYCSVECQRRAWPDHKGLCRSQRRLSSQAQSPLANASHESPQ